MKFLYKISLLIVINLFVIDNIHSQIIVIDSGHGYDSNGGNPDGRSDTENATALSVGLKLKDLIDTSCNGWTARLTRTTRNGWISLTQRRTMSNNWRADRFISIHCNAGGGTGTETFWSRSSNSSNSSNSRFSREIQDQMVAGGQWRDRRSSEDRPYLGYTLGVLNSNNAIGVLNEIGFVDSNDANKLLSNTWRNRFAQAYLEALEEDLGKTCSGDNGGGDDGGDNGSLSTDISANGSSFSSDFRVTFSDRSSNRIEQRFYRALERYGNNWYSNRRNGFFNDDCNVLYSQYTQNGGTWSASSGRLRQTNTSNTNTNLSTYLAQNGNQSYLYQFDAQVISSSGPRKFGMHMMASENNGSQRGNSYLIWFHGASNEVIVYETINNELYTRTRSTFSIPTGMQRYQVIYNPSSGQIEVFHRDRSIISWRDTSPLRSGSYISLRTNATAVNFDNIRVYKGRSDGSKTITAGNATSDDIRTPNGFIDSAIKDSSDNWAYSRPLEVRITSVNKFAEEGTDAISKSFVLYPNPLGSGRLYLDFQPKEIGMLSIVLYDFQGRKLQTLTRDIKSTQDHILDITELIENVASGNYLINLQYKGISYQTTVLKK